MKIRFIATGGTIDKIYFDRESEFKIGEPAVSEVLKEANAAFDFEVESVLRKDSLDMTRSDRLLIRDRALCCSERRIVITHGTDTMIETALVLCEIKGKIVVLTGAMQPAKFRFTDAVFNIGCAVMAVQTLSEGVYIAMNGKVFDPKTAKKNRTENRFENDSNKLT